MFFWAASTGQRKRPQRLSSRISSSVMRLASFELLLALLVFCTFSTGSCGTGGCDGSAGGGGGEDDGVSGLVEAIPGRAAAGGEAVLLAEPEPAAAATFGLTRRCMEICQGNSPSEASSPLTIRVSRMESS